MSLNMCVHKLFNSRKQNRDPNMHALDATHPQARLSPVQVIGAQLIPVRCVKRSISTVRASMVRDTTYLVSRDRVLEPLFPVLLPLRRQTH